jgi:hypothetical protein
MPIIYTDEGQFRFNDWNNLYTQFFRISNDDFGKGVFEYYIFRTSRESEKLIDAGYVYLGMREDKDELFTYYRWHYLKNEKALFNPKPIMNCEKENKNE